MNSPLTTAELLASHAAQRLSAIALVAGGREISYGQFARDLAKFRTALRGFGLRPGGSVAVTCGDIYCEWLLLLAFEQLGMATASINTREGQERRPFLATMDLVLSEQSFPGLGKPQHLVTKAWLESVLAQTEKRDDGPIASGPDQAVRILRTSGTTGESKIVVHSRRIHDLRSAHWASLARFTGTSRFLITLPFSVGTSYAFATACLRAGCTAVFAPAQDGAEFARALADNAITHVSVLPIYLYTCLNELSAGGVRPPKPVIFTFGAGVSASLAEKAVAQVAAEVCEIYGTNEAGLVACRNPLPDGTFGTVCPGVDVEVVNDRDGPVPVGELGRIRVKTDYMVHAYADDPAATAAMFKDGWFYPGDMGIMRDPRELRIVGRCDELLNIGGGKLTPAVLEEAVLKCTGARDAGVCTIRNAAGVDELCVAVVGVNSSDDELMRRIAEAFRNLELGRYTITRFDRIPRNPNGKIQRDMLRSAIARVR